MELHAVELLLLVRHGGNGTMRGGGGDGEALGYLADVVAVAHPRNAVRGKVTEEDAVIAVVGFCFAVFAHSVALGGNDVAAEGIRHQLTAVANAENGNPQFKHLGRIMRRGGIVNAVGTSRKNNTLGIDFFDARDIRSAGQYFAVHLAFADAAGNQLVILTAKVKHNGCFLHSFPHR